jgi:hypothetical protein
MSVGQGGEAGAEQSTGRGFGDQSLDRRSLIKKAGIAGAAAWVAPVVIESMISPASAASLAAGTYRLRLSSEKCNPTPVLDPDAIPTPPCAPAGFATTDFAVAQATDIATVFGITIDNCNRRYNIRVTSTNPKVTFTGAASTSGNPRFPTRCVIPTLTPTQVTWDLLGSTNRQGYFIIITVAP